MCAEKSGRRKRLKSLKKSFQNSDFRSKFNDPNAKDYNRLITKTKPSGLKPKIVVNKNKISLIATFEKCYRCKRNKSKHLNPLNT